MIYNNDRRIDTTIKKENHILWKKFNFILTYKNNKSSLFSYTSFINKSKITINLKDLLAPYTTEYVLDFSCNDFIRELDVDDGYATFEDIESAIILLLQSYISELNYED